MPSASVEGQVHGGYLASHLDPDCYRERILFASNNVLGWATISLPYIKAWRPLQAECIKATPTV